MVYLVPGAGIFRNVDQIKIFSLTPHCPSLSPPSPSWVLPSSQVRSLRREVLPTKSVAEFVQQVRALGVRPDTVYVVEDFTVADHCPTAAIWRAQYQKARAREAALGPGPQAAGQGPSEAEPPPRRVLGLYNDTCWTVAVHVRGADARKHKERVVGLSYFVRVVGAVLALTPAPQMCLHLFTDDSTPDLLAPFLEHFPTAQLHLKPQSDARQTFHHLVTADVLLLSKSGFSHLAGMLSVGVKLALPFWHTTDCDRWWVRTSEKGQFNAMAFSALWQEYTQAHPLPV